MSHKCTIGDRFFGEFGCQRIQHTQRFKKRKRNASPRVPHFVKNSTRGGGRQHDKKRLRAQEVKVICTADLLCKSAYENAPHSLKPFQDCSTKFRSKSSYENALHSRAGLCSCTRSYNSGCLPKQPLGRAEGNTVRTASRAGSQSHLCCRLAEQVCLRERWAFSRRTLLLRAPIQVEQALPKQPLGQAEGNTVRTASRAGSQSHLCCRLAEQVCLRERWAFSRRTLLLRAPIQVEQALPKQPLGQAEGLFWQG